MARISEEEFDRLEAEERHEEVLDVLARVLEKADEGGVEKLLAAQSLTLDSVAQRVRDTPDLQSALSKVSENIKSLREAFCSAAETYTIVRDRDGLIEKVIKKREVKEK